IPVVTDIQDDSGKSVVNGFTNDTTPTVSGTAAANQSLQVLLNGQVTATVTANAQGKWTYQVTSALPEGAQAFSAKATTGASGAVQSLSTTIDVTPPTVQLESNDFVGSRDTAWVKVTATDNFAVAASYHIDVDLNGNGVFTDAGEKDYAVSSVANF